MRVKIEGLVFVFILVGAVHRPSVVDGGEFAKLSGIIIPGFASTQLRAWSILDCPYSPLDFNPLDLVWLDSTKLLSAVNCWLKCMLLDPYNLTDHPECKSRADTGLSAITELDPGYITVRCFCCFTFDQNRRERERWGRVQRVQEGEEGLES